MQTHFLENHSIFYGIHVSTLLDIFNYGGTFFCMWFVQRIVLISVLTTPFTNSAARTRPYFHPLISACPPGPYLHDEFDALCPLWSQVRVCGHGGQQSLVALGVRGQVGHVLQQPLHHLKMAVLVGRQKGRGPSLVHRLKIRDKHSVDSVCFNI